MRNLFLIACVTTFATGCAASNGGGHVVGNSIMPPSASAKMAKDDKGCGCDSEKKIAKKSADCGCTECACTECACGHGKKSN